MAPKARLNYQLLPMVGLRKFEEENALHMVLRRSLYSCHDLCATYRGEIVGVRKAQSTQTLGELMSDDLGLSASAAVLLTSKISEVP